MAKILITGSADKNGIGQAGARLLVDQGHKVYLHARNQERAKDAIEAVPKAEGVVVGDISTISGAKSTAAEANKFGPFDTVVHNAALGPSAPDEKTADGLQSTFAVNVLAPYILTSMMHKPKRLLYLSSSMHSSGDDSLKDVNFQSKRYSASSAYCESKLHDIMLANAVARRWTDVQSCSLDPGWIATKMGGFGAPGKTSTPAKAIADYAVGGSSITGNKSGVYFSPRGAGSPKSAATQETKQDELMNICEQLSGIAFPK